MYKVGASQVALVINSQPGGRFDPWIRKISWKREWKPTPGFLPGEFQGQRSLAGYTPQNLKELDTTEVT